MGSTINLTAVYIANFLGIVLMLIALSGNMWRIHEKNRENYVLMSMPVITIICCLSDIINFTADGKSGFFAFICVYVGNFVLFFANLLLLPLWFILMCDRLGVSLSRRHKLIIGGFNAFGAVLLLINLFTPVVFGVDADNVYYRGNLYLYFTVMEAVFIVDSIIVYLQAKKRGGILKAFPVLIFICPVLFGTLFQATHYGISTIWPSVAVSVSGVIFSMQNELIFQDRLTGLYNRFFLDNIKESVSHKDAGKNSGHFTAMMLDLNDFKSINKKYGHQEGDQALIETAKLLQRSVGTLGRVIRYAGDEFVVLLNTQDDALVDDCIRDIKKAFLRRNRETTKSYELSVCMGWCKLNLKRKTVAQLINEVDRLMIEDKKKYYSGNKAHDRRKVRDYMEPDSERGKKLMSEIFTMFHKVAEDYICLIDVNLETEREIQYIMTSEGELPRWSDADDYTTSIRGYANMIVAPEDRERFIQMTELSRLKSILEKQKEFIIEYEAFIQNERRYFQGRFTLGNMSNNESHMLVGIRDISETREYEARSKELMEFERYKKLLDTEGVLKRTVLIAEDNELQRSILAEILKQRYHVLEAEDGEQALTILQQEYRSISLILLDLMMPRMDGYQFIRITQKDSILRNIPIIVTTADSGIDDQLKCLEMGASDFVTKPYNSKLLLNRVGTIIKWRESAATLAAVEYDQLTGLYTRQSFFHHGENILWQDIDSNYCLLVLDIENFKSINERYGTGMGDNVLKAIADYMRLFDRQGILIGRIGGDCFGGLIKTQNSSVDVSEIRQITDNMHGYLPIHNLVTKYGVYDHVDHHLDLAISYDRAALALSKVKHKYGTDIGYYDTELQQLSEKKRRIEMSMQDAYDEQQFKVYYQPKHETRTGKLVGAEALIRWIHPEFGFMSPGEFIPLFEQNGFISLADYFVWKRTCENIRRWLDMDFPVVPISVNASRLDFTVTNMLERMNEIVEEEHISPDYLHLEVTESVFSENIEIIKNILNACREYGYLVELDDFGSGYSSLNTLSELPIDIVKFDMSFMRETGKPSKDKVLSACVNLAKSMGFKTTIEGVETDDQLKRAMEYGLDVIQGYYYSKPLPEDEFAAYLVAHGQTDRTV